MTLRLARAAGTEVLDVREADPAELSVELDSGLRRLFLVLAIACVPAVAAGAALFYSVPWFYRTDELPVGQLVPWAITFALAGARLAPDVRARAVGGALLITACLISLSILADGLLVTSYLRAWDGATSPLRAATAAAFVVGVGSTYVVLPQVFPEPPRSRFGRSVLRVSVGVLGLAAVLAVLMTLTESESIWAAGSLSIGVGWLVGLASLLARWWRGSRRARRQIVWLCLLMAASPPLMLLLAVGVIPDAASDLFLFSWPLAMVVAILAPVLQHRLYDSRFFLVRRVALYAGLTVVLTTIFAAAYLVVTLTAIDSATATRYRWAPAVAAVATVLLAEPVRARLRSRLERRLLGERGVPLRALSRLGSTRDEGDEQAILDAIVGAVADAVRAPGVSLALRHDGGLRLVALRGRAAEGALSVPLLHGGESLGELRVSARTPGESFSRSDRTFIDQLAAQIAAVVYGLRRDRELALARREALAAVAEERARLGRDIHDRLGPLLAGASLTAEALRRGMPLGSPDEGEAGQLAKRLRDAATEMRRVAHNLQPALAEGGLVEGLRDHAARLTASGSARFVVHATTLPALPPVVEQCAYLVLLEAMNNVAVHAAASAAEVRLAWHDPELVLSVVDDGVGLAQPYVSGLGITSMRSRVQALGGTFDLQPAGSAGTRLEARIPVSS